MVAIETEAHTVSKREVCILLECYLVTYILIVTDPGPIATAFYFEFIPLSAFFHCLIVFLNMEFLLQKQVHKIG